MLFRSPDLPYKHLPAFRYARRFVASVRRRTLVAYGAIGGAQGRVYADGRALVAFDGGREVEIGPDGEPTRPHGNGRQQEEEEEEEEDVARRVYQWLLRHPLPPHIPAQAQAQAAEGWGGRGGAEQWGGRGGEWRLTEGTRFVRGLGWCREEGKGRWSMRFLDGVGLEIRDKSVVHIEHGVRTPVRLGLRDPDVRRRVGLFVKAGV